MEQQQATEHYAIKHRLSGEFFSGFDAKTLEPMWGPQTDARHYSRADAHGQALLFRCNDIAAQIKPVSVSHA